MIRILTPEEAEFKDRCRRAVWDFILEEGLNWHIATHSQTIEESIWSIANELWYIKNHVEPEQDDIMNSREARKKWEGDVKND
jgi:hypothetical protein